jgi:hypothetical protein
MLQPISLRAPGARYDANMAAGVVIFGKDT